MFFFYKEAVREIFTSDIHSVTQLSTCQDIEFKDSLEIFFQEYFTHNNYYF